MIEYINEKYVTDKELINFYMKHKNKKLCEVSFLCIRRWQHIVIEMKTRRIGPYSNNFDEARKYT